MKELTLREIQLGRQLGVLKSVKKYVRISDYDISCFSGLFLERSDIRDLFPGMTM